MKAVLLTRHGGPDVLQITNVPDPHPRPGEVRVRVRLIGVNFAEVLSRRGLYAWAPPLPYIPGMEAFGEVDALGEGVTSHRVGDPVVVGTKFGTYAELLCVPAERALTPPHGLSPEESAAFAVNFLTAWIGIMEMARLRASDTLLVTSAAGGVGSAAVQIGARSRARVIAVSSHGQETVRTFGASAVLGYDELQRAPHLCVDAALEMSGGAACRAVLRHLAPMGRVVIAGASAAFPRTRNPLARLASLALMPRASILDMLRRSYGVMSFHVGWLLESGAVARPWADLVRFAEEHGVRPVVGEELPFERVADAHRALEERRNVGKVLVRVR